MPDITENLLIDLVNKFRHMELKARNNSALPVSANEITAYREPGTNKFIIGAHQKSGYRYYSVIEIRPEIPIGPLSSNCSIATGEFISENAPLIRKRKIY